MTENFFGFIFDSGAKGYNVPYFFEIILSSMKDFEISNLIGFYYGDVTDSCNIIDIDRKVIIDLVARIQAHGGDPKYKKLGEKLEELKEQHEQGLLNSIEFLKALLELAKETAQAEKEVVPDEEIDKGRNALTELFNGIKNRATPIIVTRVVDDIDAIVKRVRFDGWQNTLQGKKDIKKELRKIIWIKYQIKDQDVFDKACGYVEMYY